MMSINRVEQRSTVLHDVESVTRTLLICAIEGLDVEVILSKKAKQNKTKITTTTTRIKIPAWLQGLGNDRTMES